MNSENDVEVNYLENDDRLSNDCSLYRKSARLPIPSDKPDDIYKNSSSGSGFFCCLMGVACLINKFWLSVGS